jgi:hypothetical protein
MTVARLLERFGFRRRFVLAQPHFNAFRRQIIAQRGRIALTIDGKLTRQADVGALERLDGSLRVDVEFAQGN